MKFGKSRVLGIELDNGISRIIEMEYKSKTPTVYHAFTLPSPTDLLSDEGLVTENERFRSDFRAALKQRAITSERTVFSVSSSRIINREITIPMVRGNKIESLLYQNAADYFPVDITDYQLVYRIVDKIEQTGSRSYKLHVSAVPRDILRSYHQFAEFLGLNHVSLNLADNGIAQAILLTAKDKIDSDKTELYLSVYAEHTLLLFVRGETVCSQRTLSVGHSGARSFEELHPLMTAIRRSVEYYLSAATAEQLCVHLIGGICQFEGFAEMLGAELKQPIGLLEIHSEKLYSAAEYFALLGACMRPPNLAVRKQVGVYSPTKEFHRSYVQNVLLGIGIGCFVICVSLTIASVIRIKAEKNALASHEEQLRAELGALDNTGGEKDAYENALLVYQTLSDSVSAFEQYTETNNDHFVAFLEELEEKMPSEFRIVGLTVSEIGVEMDIQVSAKEEAAYVLRTLRNCASVTMGEPSDITVTQDETASDILLFTVSLTYTGQFEEEGGH